MSNKFNKYLTGDRNLDMEILLKLRDDELTAVCQANKYIKNICEDENFWIKRLFRRLQTGRENIEILFRERIKRNISSYRNINIENVREFKEYYGFDTFKELNDWLNKFLPNTAYWIFLEFGRPTTEEIQNNTINFWFSIDKTRFPKYINYDELMKEIKRQYVYNYFHPIIFDNDIIIDRPVLLGLSYKSNPGFQRNQIGNILLKLPFYEYLKNIKVIE